MIATKTRRALWLVPAVVFVLSVVAGERLIGALRAEPRAAAVLPGPVRGSASIEGRWRDPFGHPPWNRINKATSYKNVKLLLPPWAVLVWRDKSGAICHEPGEIVNLATNPLFGNVIPQIEAKAADRPKGWRVGAIRPDAKFGTGRQLYGLGRFLEYPREVGGSCGDPSAEPGLIFSREVWHSRQDLGPVRTIIDGVAGPRVRSVALVRDGRTIRLPLSKRRAFIAVFKGDLAPSSLPLIVTYTDGSERRFA
jgi:hypothetical protein